MLKSVRCYLRYVVAPLGFAVLSICDPGSAAPGT